MNTNHSKTQGFTLIEILTTSIIILIASITFFSLGLNYHQRSRLEANIIKVNNFIEITKQQSILSFDKQQLGILVNPTNHSFVQVARATPSSPIIEIKTQTLPNEFIITNPSNETHIWFDRKTGFTGTYNQITLQSNDFQAIIEITTSGKINISPITPL